MSATPIRRRTRLATPLVGTLLALGLLAGCAGQTAPGSYGAGVKRDFVEGCWTTLVRDAEGKAAEATDGAPLPAEQLEDEFPAEAEAAKKQCACAYGKFTEDLKFSEFKNINDDQTEQPAELGATVRKIYESCKVGDTPEG